jgi:hypothetical protein
VSYHEAKIIRGGKGVNPNDDSNPVGVDLVHLLGGEREIASRIKE